MRKRPPMTLPVRSAMRRLSPQAGGGHKEWRQEPDERQPITLDRYMSRHRGRSAVSWPHVGALIIMLAILVALVMFKDRCGEAVSDIVFMLSPDASAPAKVRIELERPAAKPGNEAPTSKPSK